MLTPGDLRRLPNPLLRARFTAHLLDEPGPNQDEFEAIFRTAVEELMAAGFGVAEIAAGTFMEERELRRRLLCRLDAPATEPAYPDGDDEYAAAVAAWREREAALRHRLASLNGNATRLGERARRELLALDREEDDSWLAVVAAARRRGAPPPQRDRPPLPF